MKLLGHVYIAVEAFPERTEKLLAMGAVLPELVFYVKDKAFTHEELHEGGEILYKYLQSKSPDKIDLAVGILAHSNKYGADGLFNSHRHLRKIGLVKKDIQKTAEALNVSTKRAEIAVHNLYSLSLDYWLNSNKPQLLEIVKGVDLKSLKEIAPLLSDCYKKDISRVEKNLLSMWDIYDLNAVKDFRNLAKLWQKLASNANSPDKVNVEKTAKLLEEFYEKMRPNTQKFLEKAVKETGAKVEKALNSLE